MKSEQVPGSAPETEAESQVEVEDSVAPQHRRSSLKRFATKLVTGVAFVTAVGAPAVGFTKDSHGTEAHHKETKEEKKAREEREKNEEQQEKKLEKEAEERRKEFIKEREERQEKEEEKADKARKQKDKEAKDLLDEVRHQEKLRKKGEPTKAMRIASARESHEAGLRRLETAIKEAKYVEVSAQGGNLYSTNFLRNIVAKSGGKYEKPAKADPEDKRPVLLLTAEIERSYGDARGYDVRLSARLKGPGEPVIGFGLGSAYDAIYSNRKHSDVLQSEALEEAWKQYR